MAADHRRGRPAAARRGLGHGRAPRRGRLPAGGLRRPGPHRAGAPRRPGRGRAARARARTPWPERCARSAPRSRSSSRPAVRERLARLGAELVRPLRTRSRPRSGDGRRSATVAARLPVQAPPSLPPDDGDHEPGGHTDGDAPRPGRWRGRRARRTGAARGWPWPARTGRPWPRSGAIFQATSGWATSTSTNRPTIMATMVAAVRASSGRTSCGPGEGVGAEDRGRGDDAGRDRHGQDPAEEAGPVALVARRQREHEGRQADGQRADERQVAGQERVRARRRRPRRRPAPPSTRS